MAVGSFLRPTQGLLACFALEPSRALDEASRAAASCLSLWGSRSETLRLHALRPGWDWSSSAAEAGCFFSLPVVVARPGP